MKFLLPCFILALLPVAAHAQNHPSTPATVGQIQQSLDYAKVEMHLADFQKMRSEGGVTVIDVRSPESYARKHLKGAINIPLTELTEKTLATSVPDKEKPVAIMCDFSLAPTRMIAMTVQAFPVLKLAGYKKVYRLNLWVNPNGPVMTEEQIEKALPFEKSQPVEKSLPQNKAAE